MSCEMNMLVVLGFLLGLSGKQVRAESLGQSQSFDIFAYGQAAVAYEGELPCANIYDCGCVFNHQRSCCCADGQFHMLRESTFNRLLDLWRTLVTLSDSVEALIGETHVSFAASFQLNSSSMVKPERDLDGNVTQQCFGPFSCNVTIPYNLVSLNHGNAYNPGLGTFTAPRTGIYLFTFSAYSHVGPARERLYHQVQLMRNGEVMASVWEDNIEDSEDSASQTVILSLDRGGQVYVQLMLGRRLCDLWGLSTFSGYLIYPHDP